METSWEIPSSNMYLRVKQEMVKRLSHKYVLCIARIIKSNLRCEFGIPRDVKFVLKVMNATLRRDSRDAKPPTKL